MFTKCGCDRCPANLSWKFEGHFLFTSESTQVLFDQAKVAGSYARVVKELDIPGFSPPKVPTKATYCPMINLCANCWPRQADNWGRGGRGVYANKPGKTAYDGIYFNNDLRAPGYGYFEGNTPDIEKIMSTAVHEMSHYWSKNRKGLDGQISHERLNWDECVTEFLARKTFFLFRQGRYKTNYGTLSEFISQAVSKVLPVPDFKLPVVLKFPEPFKSLAQARPLTDAMKQALAKKFVTWYLKGGDEKVDGQNIGQFVSPATDEPQIFNFFFGSFTLGNYGPESFAA